MRTNITEWMICPSKKDREEGKRIIREVMVPRIEKSWWNGNMNGGRYCPITAMPFRLKTSINSFIHERLDRVAKDITNGEQKLITTFNDTHTKKEVIEALERAAS